MWVHAKQREVSLVGRLLCVMLKMGVNRLLLGETVKTELGTEMKRLAARDTGHLST